MTSQFTRDIDYPRYEISTGSVFLNLIYCNVFIAILSIACMTGALWAKRGERDISRGARHEREARDEGKRKIKRLFAVHCSCCSAHLRPQILTTRGDVKRTNQNTIHCQAKIVPFLARSVCIAIETRRCRSVYLGVVVLSVREACYVYEGYVGSVVVLYIWRVSWDVWSTRLGVILEVDC